MTVDKMIGELEQLRDEFGGHLEVFSVDIASGVSSETGSVFYRKYPTDAGWSEGALVGRTDPYIELLLG